MKDFYDNSIKPCKIHFTQHRRRANYMAYMTPRRYLADICFTRHSGIINRVEIVDNYWRADITLFLVGRRHHKALNLYERKINEHFAFSIQDRKAFNKYFCPGPSELQKNFQKLSNY